MTAFVFSVQNKLIQGVIYALTVSVMKINDTHIGWVPHWKEANQDR